MLINKFNFLLALKIFIVKLLQISSQEKKEFFVSNLSIFFTILSLIFINFIIYLYYPDNSEALRIKAEKLIIEYHHLFLDGIGGNIWPEPIERIQILTTLISIPLLIFFYIKIFSSKFFNKISLADNTYFFNLTVCSSILVILFYFAFTINGSNFLLHETYPFHQEIRNLYKAISGELRFLISLILFPFTTYFILMGIPKKNENCLNWVLNSLVVIMLLGAFLLSITNRDNYIGHLWHLSSVLHPVSQVQEGKAVLVDFVSQYGLYSHFLYPLFKLINVSIVTFSITMSALTVTSFSLIYFGLRKIISNRLIVFLSFVAIMYFTYFQSFLNDNFDIYYQYKPLRIIFPSLMLFTVFGYIFNPNKIKYLLIIFISSLAILWNFDSGIICFLSFYIYILYEKLFDRNLKAYIADFFKHTITSLSILALTILLYSLIIYFQFDDFPDWNLFFTGTLIFGAYGMFVLPMPLFGLWNLIFLVYLYGIYIGLNATLLNKKNPLDKVTFFVAIFGLGISSYYLNRSHDYNLLQTLYPSLILLAIFLCKSADKFSRESLFRIKDFLIALLISFILVVIFIQTFQPAKLINSLIDRVPDVVNDRLSSRKLSDGAKLISFNSNKNDQIQILSSNESLIYLETKTSSAFSSPDLTSVILKSQWDRLQDSLIKNKSYKVYIYENFLETDNLPTTRHSDFKKILTDYYYLDDWLGGWRMFIPKNYISTDDSTLKAKASYSLMCPDNSNKCNDIYNNLNPIENFNTDTNFIKVDFNLSSPINLQSIMLHVILDSNYNGTLTTLPIEGLSNIAILDSQNKKVINTSERSDQLNYTVKQNFSILIPNSNYINTCDPFIIELIYNDNKKIKLRASCSK